MPRLWHRSDQPTVGLLEPTTTEAPSTGSSRPLSLLWRPAAIYLASRAGVLLVILGLSYVQHFPIRIALLNWDSRWYLRIAEHGYPHAVPPGVGPPAQSNLGFFPLLPLLIRLIHAITRLSFPDAGLVLTGVLGLLAAGAVWNLVYTSADAAAADRGTALLFFSPAAFVFSMVYAEPLLIALGASALYCLRQRRWVLAGLCAGLMTATDPLGVAILVPCLLAGWEALRRLQDTRALAAPGLGVCGVAGFAIYLWIHTGSPLTWMVAQRRGWQNGHFAAGIPVAWRYIIEHGFGNPNYTIKGISTVLVLAMFLLFVRWRAPRTEVGYVGAVLLLAAISPIVALSPRVALRAFPLLARTGARLSQSWFVIVLGLSALTLSAVTILALGVSKLPFTP